MAKTQQTMHVLLHRHHAIQKPEWLDKIKVDSGDIEKSGIIRCPAHLLASGKPVLSPHTIESAAIQELRPISAMKILKECLQVERVIITNGEPGLSPDGKELHLTKEGFLGISFLASQFGERTQKTARGLFPLLLNPMDAPKDWTARDWADALLFVEMARNGVEGMLTDLVLSREGVQWLRQKKLPFANSEIVAQMYEAQFELYRTIYEHAKK